MNAKKPKDRGGRKWTGVVVTLAAVLLAATASWAAGTVDVSGDLPLPVTDASLTDALWQVNNNKGATNSFVVTVKGDQNSGNNTILKADNANWFIHGMDNAENYNLPISGFGSITVQGDGTTQKVITGNGDGAVLKILHATEHLRVDNLKITGGNIDDSTNSSYVTRSEIGGGGMMLGSDGGMGTTPFYAPITVVVTDVDVERNAINLNGTASNAYGGGIYVSGVGGGSSGPNTTMGISEVYFESVNLKNNAINFTRPVVGDASVRGGGARVGYAKSFGYVGGEVSGNEIVFSGAQAGDHAAGGGLALDGHSAATFESVDIQNVKFVGNSISMNGIGGDMRGGGFYFLGSNTTLNPIDVSFDSRTEFRENKLIATGSGWGDQINAYGGGVYIALNDANALFDGTLFVSNSANAAGGIGAGGAIAVETLYTTNAPMGNLTVENAYFQGNEATGADARGGAIHSGVKANHAVTDSEFLSNAARGESFATGGAIHFVEGDNNLSGNTFDRNTATASSFLGEAVGGAVALGVGKNNLDDTAFIGNSAEAAGISGYAAGGALAVLGDGANSVSLANATFNLNTVRAGDVAYGGAIYLQAGSLDLSNATLTNNLAVSSVIESAQGGAIYADTTSTTSSIVNLSAGEGKETLISGNRAGGYASGIHFGINEANGADSRSDARLNISGLGTVSLLDPVTVSMNSVKNFTMTKNDAGTLVWGGTNTFNTIGGISTIKLNEGTVELTDSFTAKGYDTLGQLSGYHVEIGEDATLKFSISRDQNLAMFDFSNAGSKQLTVGPGATLTTSLGREIISQTWKFAIARGASESDLLAARDNFDFVQEGNLANILDLVVQGDTLYATVEFNSPFDQSGVNPKSAQKALDNILKNLGDKITDEEYWGILENPYAVTPELYMDQSIIMMNAVGSVARRAVDYGTRHPHRMRMRMQNAPSAPSYDSYEVVEEVYEEVYEDRRYGSGRGYRSYDAYPSLATCTNDSGLRLWAGYVGDFDRRNSHGGYQGYTSDRHGILIGLNYDFGLRGSFGVYGAYTYSESESHKSDQKTTADNGHFGVTGRFSPLICNPEFSIYADAGYHFAANDFHRTLGNYEARNSFDQNAYTVGLGMEYMYMMGSSYITPYAEGRFTHINQDALKETGSSITTTNTDEIRESFFHTRLGIEFSRDFQTACGIVTPSLNVAWRHEFGERRNTARAFYVNDPTGTPFFLSSSALERDSADVGFNLKTLHQMGSGNMLAITAAYNLNLSRRSTTHTIYAGFDIGF